MSTSFLEILNLFQWGKSTTKIHLKNLIEMASVDGKYTDEENELLSSIASRNGISINRIEEIKASQSVPISVPKTDEEKFSQIYDLVRMMLVDQNVHPEEVRVSELLASHFGYPKTDIKEMVDTIKQNILNGNDMHDTYERIIYYLKVKRLRMSTVKVRTRLDNL